MNFKQDALNQWRRKKKKQLELKLEALQNAQTRTQRDARKQIMDELELFCCQAFPNDEDLHPTAQHAALSIQ